MAPVVLFLAVMRYVEWLQAVTVLPALLVGLGACAGPSDATDSQLATDEAALQPGVAPACEPVAAASETLTVRNQFGPIEGTLAVPAGCNGMPVVLVISGSGYQDRDGNPPEGPLYRTNVYKLLADGLRDAGVAVLRFDDVGAARSAGAAPANETDLVYETEIDAAWRWVERLHADPRFGKVIVAGHSQGSLTAILLGQRDGVDGVISLAGAGRPIAEVLREQAKPTLLPWQLAKLDAALASLQAGELPGELRPPLDKLLPVSAQPYLISWMKYDPTVEIAKLKKPTIIVQGKTDLQVSVADAELLAAAKPDARLVVIDDMCHPLKRALIKSQLFQLGQYVNPNLPLHPKLVPTLSAFVDTSF